MEPLTRSPAEAKNRKLVRRYFGKEFAPLLEIVRGERKLLYVFARAHGEPVTRLSVSAGHHAYLEAYPSLCSR